MPHHTLDSASAASNDKVDEQFTDNGLMIEDAPFNLEKIYDYETGGHHPVHLNDVLNRRYKVIHKLGSGGYANVWLCRDISGNVPQYVGVKIIMASFSTKDCSELRVYKLVDKGTDQVSSSDYFSLPLERFKIEGPNGLHYAFVYRVHGPRVSKLLGLARCKDSGKALRRVCRHLTEALAALHARHICHGDLRPGNVLAQVSGIDGLSEGEVIQALGPPQTTEVVKRSGESHTLTTAPQYLVYPVDWDKVGSEVLGEQYFAGKACIIDFGESYSMSEPPDDLGIPETYCPPEYILDKQVGVGCDIWALGCTLFEIRTGKRLFGTFDDDLDDHLCMIAELIGKFPEPWWSEKWEARKRYYEDEADENGRVVEVRRESHLAGGFQQPEIRSLKGDMARGLFYEDEWGPERILEEIPEDEIELFSDLLSRLFKFSPNDRLTAKEALEHGWFKLDI